MRVHTEFFMGVHHVNAWWTLYQDYEPDYEPRGCAKSGRILHLDVGFMVRVG